MPGLVIKCAFDFLVLPHGEVSGDFDFSLPNGSINLIGYLINILFNCLFFCIDTLKENHYYQD